MIFMGFVDQFQKYMHTPHVEVEFRLGTKAANKVFNTDIGEEKFKRIYNILTKYDAWENVCTEETTVFQNKTQRVVVNDHTGEQDRHQKERLWHRDWRLSGNFDVRASICTETPLAETDDMETMRKRKRTSFSRKNTRIDLTVTESDDPDSEESLYHQVEIEILDPLEVTGPGELYNIIHKIQCIDILIPSSS